MTTILITGANRGIGLAFARLFRERGETVIGTVRRPDEASALRGLGVRVERLEVTDDGSVAALAARLDEVAAAVDLLIANAGILAEDDLENLDAARVLEQLDVNAVGPLRVVRALVPSLRRAAAPRVVAVSSVMASMGSMREGGYYGYRASKAALNAVVRALSFDLAPMPVVAVHPGYVRTGLTGGRGHLTPEESVADLIGVVDRIDPSMSGRFFDRHGEELPW